MRTRYALATCIASTALLGTGVSTAVAEERPPRAVIGVGLVPSDARPSLSRLQTHDGLELVQPRAAEVEARDALLARARQAYARMDFTRALSEGSAAETRLIDGQVPTLERNERLADVEVFIGACLLLGHDARAAADRFLIARALSPSVAVDPIFPPEVAQALTAARAAAPVPVELLVAPAGARVWVDGQAREIPTQLTPGVHYLVVERADRMPQAALVRVGRARTRIELSASTPRSHDAAAGALSSTTLTETEGVELSRLLGAPAWRLQVEGGKLEGRRWLATDVAHPSTSLTVPSLRPEAVEQAICAVERCDLPVGSTTTTTRAAQPLHKRAWFWGVVGGGAALVVGVIIIGAVVATRPRDYEAVLR